MPSNGNEARILRTKWENRELKKTATAAATGMSPNKIFNK